MPAQAIHYQEEAEFLAVFAVFEPENTPEQRLIEGLRIQIESNPHFGQFLNKDTVTVVKYPVLEVLLSENFTMYIICNTNTRR
jgi:hypothetical protein